MSLMGQAPQSGFGNLFNRPDIKKSVAHGTGIGGKYRKQYEKEVEAGDLYKNRFNPFDENYRPELTDKRIAGANRFYDIGMSDKLDPQAQAQLDAIRRQSQTAERGSREAILQNAQASGAGTGTANFMSQMLNQQRGADRMSQEGTNVAANQWTRAMNALQGGMNAYAGINQDEMQRAKLQEDFDRFNIGGQASTLRNQGQLIADAAGRRRKFLGGLFKTAIGVGSAAMGNPAGLMQASQGAGQMTGGWSQAPSQSGFNTGQFDFGGGAIGDMSKYGL